MAKRAIVIGGSIGGLFAGLFLKRIGWDVTIHERVGEELGARGAGIVTHDELHDALAAATGGREPIGVPVSGRVVLAQDGSVVCETLRPQILASWDQVWQRLRACSDGFYRHGSALVSFEQNDSVVTARFADGARENADLLVAADGIQSTVRKQLFPDAQPRYVGYAAWRGLVEETELSPAARDRLFDCFGFCLPPREQMLGYPVDGPPIASQPTRRYNYVWYRPADPDRELPRMLKGADGHQYVGAIPPDKLHPDIVAEMRDAATRLLAPAFAEAVSKTRKPLLQPIVDLETPAMASGRVAILGDAAFVARPHVGAGVTKAAGDARALAEVLSAHSSIDDALAAYNAQRHAFGQRIVRRARDLGAYMQAQLLSEEERQLAEKHRSPQAVMTETATMHNMASW
ncbi:MAG: monooxygenase [Proteobacteria bacterium SG_bin9]|nr:MAG: monooxygenase [Proteobacteria bacterium SG_bin9]